MFGFVDSKNGRRADVCPLSSLSIREVKTLVESSVWWTQNAGESVRLSQRPNSTSMTRDPQVCLNYFL